MNASNPSVATTLLVYILTLQCFKEGGDKESKNKMKNHTQLLLSNSFTPHVGG